MNHDAKKSKTMKKSLFIIPFALIFNFMEAQGLSKNGAVVKDVIINNLKVGAVTYPNSDGTSNQVLITDGAGNVSWSTPSTTATAYSGVLPVANGGTGSDTPNFVDLTTDQTVAGTKTFSSDIFIKGVKVGSGSDAIEYNTAVGAGALQNNAGGPYNTANGYDALNSNTNGTGNTAMGTWSLHTNSGGNYNTANGVMALGTNSVGNENTANGAGALETNTTGIRNSAMGRNSLYRNTTGSNNVAIGYKADVASGNLTNATAIGSLAMVSASNTIQLGNVDVTSVKTTGQLTTGAVTYPNIDGIPNQVLTTDGAGTAIWTTPASAGIPYAGASQAVNLGEFDLTVNGITIGRGASGIDANTAIGNQALLRNTTGFSNTATGLYALVNNITGSGNTANGAETLSTNSTGDNNTAIGFQALFYSSTSSNNTAIGFTSLMNNETGSGNVAIGTASLLSNVTGNNNTAIGNSAGVINDNLSNTIAIGYNAKVAESNTIQLGDANVTGVRTSGQLTTGEITYPNNSGTAGQVLTTNGAGIASWRDPFIDSSIAPTVNGLNVPNYLSDMESGKIIYLSQNINYDFSQLSNGFTCTFINSNTDLNSNKILIYGYESSFYSVLTPQGSSDFSIPSGGIVKLIVAIVNSERRYYVTGDGIATPAP